MLRKLIHILFLPCSEATLLMEKRNAENISSKENWKLSIHLKICKWCKAYERKLEILDDVLKKDFSQRKENEVDNFDIHDFKNKMFEKLDS